MEEDYEKHEPDRGEEASWKSMQKSTFSRWCNMQLRMRRAGSSSIGASSTAVLGGSPSQESSTALSQPPPYQIMDLYVDFSDGLMLIALVEALTSHLFRKTNKRPAFRTQKLENVTQALTYLETEEGIRLVNIGTYFDVFYISFLYYITPRSLIEYFLNLLNCRQQRYCGQQLEADSGPHLDTDSALLSGVGRVGGRRTADGSHEHNGRALVRTRAIGRRAGRAAGRRGRRAAAHAAARVDQLEDPGPAGGEPHDRLERREGYRSARRRHRTRYLECLFTRGLVPVPMCRSAHVTSFHLLTCELSHWRLHC